MNGIGGGVPVGDHKAAVFIPVFPVCLIGCIAVDCIKSGSSEGANRIGFIPKLTAEKKQALSEAAEEVLLTRADHPEKTLAELYDPEKMPEDLRNAHHVLDDLVESCYPGYPFANDEARLECLFKLYEKMTAK